MDILNELNLFYLATSGEKGSIGKSLLGKDLYYFCVRKTACPVVIVQYAIHAREYITTYLALKHIKDYMKNGAKGTVYFIPALNPDGISVSLSGKPLYKSNARGVDLNVNFDARWGLGETNTVIKGDQNCIGEYPFSEPETRAIRDFTLKIRPDITVSYHSKGEEIYWYFYQDGVRRAKDVKIARAVSEITGYPLKLTPNSAGGYKDWCIEKLKIPSLTIEVGDDGLCHPLKKTDLPAIYQKNKDVIKLITEIV